MTAYEIEGADRLAQTLDAAARKLADIDQTAGAAAATDLARQAAQAAPRATGRLATSHHARTGEVAVSAPYAAFVHYGTRHMRGRPWLTDTADHGDWIDAYSDELDTITNQIKGA